MRFSRQFLGDLYDIDPLVLDPTDFGWCARRKQRYCILLLKRIAPLDRPVCELLDALRATFQSGPGSTPFWTQAEPLVLIGSYAHHAQGYVSRYTDLSGIFDVAQSPVGHPRVSRGCDSCMILPLIAVSFSARMKTVASSQPNRCPSRAFLRLPRLLRLWGSACLTVI